MNFGLRLYPTLWEFVWSPRVKPHPAEFWFFIVPVGKRDYEFLILKTFDKIMKIEELFFWARWSALGSLGGFVAATKWLNVSRIHALIYGAHSSICCGPQFSFP